MTQLSRAQDATEFFQAGLVTYNLGQKARQLKVDTILAAKCNGVSMLTAEQMHYMYPGGFVRHGPFLQVMPRLYRR